MKDNLTHARTCVYNINYHVAWPVKYRRKVLTQDVEASVKAILSDVAEDKGFILHVAEVGECDHIHRFVSAPPKLSITYIYYKNDEGHFLPQTI